MIKTIGQFIGVLAVLYVVGFLWVMSLVMFEGYQGGDMLTEHYRSVLQAITN